MEKWDKGIQMFEEATPVDPDVMEKLDLIADFHRHRAKGVTFLLTPWQGHRTQALQLVKDPETGAYGLPDEKGEVTE